MANDKKFIVKNGLQSQENVVIGSSTDNGVNKLQVTGSSKFTGAVEIAQTAKATPTVKFTNSGGPTSLIAEFVGDSSSVQITNVSPGDYAILNTGQSNGIKLYNNAAGMELLYNGSVDMSFNSVGIDFKREPTYQGSVFWNAGNDGAGSGLDADLIDGLDSLQFVRSDQSDTMDGDYIITGNLTVQGTTTTINTETVLIADNILTLNSNFTTGTPTENAGWEVLRGNANTSSLQWDETNDYFKLISAGADLGRIITTADEAVNGGSFDAATLDGLDSTQFLRSDIDDTAAGNITIQGDLTVGDGAGFANIKMNGAGADGTLSSSAGEIGFLNSSFAFGLKLNAAGDVEVKDDIFAQKFIDINNNTYQVIPSGASVLNNIDLEGALRHNGNTTTLINFPATNRIGFTLGGVQYGLMTNASFQYTGDMIADRFLDRSNNAYYVDPASSSVLNTVGVDSDLFHNGNATTKLAFGTNTIDLHTNGSSRLTIADASITSAVNVYAPRYYDSNNNSFYLDPASTSELNSANFYSGAANNAVNIGISAAERFNIDVTGSQGYIRYIQDETNATDHSVNFEIISSGIGLNKFKFNKDIDVGTNTVNGGFGNFSSGVYASIFYDYDDETYFADFNNVGNSINMAGTIEGGNGTAAAPTYTFGSDTNTGMLRGAADRLDFSAGGNVELQVFTTYSLAPGSFRAPLFYDTNNTAYYGDFAGTSQMAQIDIDSYIRHRGDTDNYFGFAANDTFRVWTGATQRLNIDNDSADFSVNTYAPRYYDSVSTTYYLQPGSTSVLNKISIDDYVIHNADTNTYIGFDAADQFGAWTGGVKRLNITTTAATFTNSVYAPDFYTNDYLIHNGDTNTYIGFDAVDQFGVWTGGTKRINVDTEVDLLVNTNVTGNLDVTGRATIGNSLTRPNDLSVLTNSAARIGGSDVHLHIASLSSAGNYAVAMQSGRQSDNVSFPMALQPNGGNVSIGTLTAGATLTINKTTAQGNNPFAAGTSLLSLGDAGTVDLSIRTDSLGNVYYINDNGGDQIWYDTGASGKFAIFNDGNVVAGSDSYINANPDATTNFIATPAANRFHSSGGISIEGKDSLLSIYNADGANTAINEATFLGVNELGFSAGGGFYMNETTTMYARGNKAIYTTGNIFAGRFYDANNNAYYVDPASTSVMNRIDLDDYIRHNGDTNTYFGFSGNNVFKLFTNSGQRVNIDNNSADFSVNVYAPRYYDSNDNNYYLDPAADSQLNTIDIDDYVRHRGNTDAYFGFSGNNVFKLFTNGTERVNVDANSADFAVNVYAPRYYDSDDTTYYVDPAAVSIMNNVSFGSPGNGNTVKGRFISIEGSTDASGEGSGRIFFAEHNSTVAAQDAYGMSLAYQGGSASITSVTGQPVTLNGTSNGTWALIGHNNSVNGSWAMRGPRDAGYVEARGSFRAPLFYDSNDTAYYTDPASTSVTNIMRANQFQVDGSTYIIDSPSGDYGSIRVDGAKGGYAGYIIRDDWGFISDGTTTSGLYNDTRNEWSLRSTDNNRTEIFANGVAQLSAENGYGFAVNSMRSPIFYDSNNTAYFGNFAAGNTGQALKINGRIFREGFTADNGANNWYLNAQDANHFIWNTATNWGLFWATNTSAAYRHVPFGDNMMTFVGAGNVRAAIDLDSGDLYAQGEVYAGNFNLDTGGDSFPLNPSYGSGTSELKLFDGNKYWEKRAIDALQGLESAPTGTISEYVKSPDAPGSSSYVLRSSGYRTFYSDYIEVEPGEEIYGEMYVKYISGSGGLFYYGVERFDKNKNPIAGNTGTTYFVAGGNNVTSTSWQKFSGHTTIPTSHTAYAGSDGAGARYVRIRILMNYSTGGALREFTPPILTRTQVHSRVRTDQAMYSPIYYDSNDNNFYLDPASTSKLDTVDASNFRDRDNTARFMNPATGGNVQGTWNWNNGTISNLNNLTFGDPGPNEGIEWLGGNGWKIYESPDDLSTNTGGNLQFVTGSTMRARIDSVGDVHAGRYMRAQRFYDSNDGAFYLDPASRSLLADLQVQSTKASNILEVRRTGSSPGNDVTALFANQFSNHSWGLVAEFRTDGNSGGDRPSISWSSGLSATGWSAGMFDGNEWGVRFNHGYRHGGWGTEAFRVDTGRNLRVSNGLFAANAYASIFYDNDNTAYYGDFAGTTRTNAILTNTLEFDNGWDIYDDNAETLTIRSNNSDHGYISFRDSDSTECGRIEFDDDGFWGLKTPSNEWAVLMYQNAQTEIHYNGTWEGRSESNYFRGRASFRAPFFYDVDNTAYYSNQAGTSNYNILNVQSLGTASTITMGGRIFVDDVQDYDNTVVTGLTDAPISTRNRDTNVGTADAYLPLTHQTALYNSGYRTHLNTGLFKRASAWGDNSTGWYAALGGNDSYPTMDWRLTYGTDIYNSNGYVSTPGSFRAPIFYDTNNTGYYGDFASTSRLNAMNINSSNHVGGGIATFQTASGTNRGFIQATETNDAHLIIATSGGEDISFRDGGVAGQWNMIIRGDGNVETLGSNYAQQFVDRNNTGYYGDFASTSVMNTLDIRGEVYNDGWFRNDTSGRGLYNTAHDQHWYATSATQWRLFTGPGNTQEIAFSTAGNNIRGHVYADNSNNIGFLDQSHNWALRTNGGTTEVYGNLYANVMYDRNDSGYYIDSNGTSVTNEMRANNFVHRGAVSDGSQFGLYTDAGKSTAYAIYKEGGAWTFPYPDLRIAFHTGIKFGANASYNGMRFYTDYDMSGQVMSVNNGSDPLGGGNVYVNNNLQAGSSLRAPIFYDSNNTAYYFDGASINSTRFEGVSNRTKAHMALSGQTRSSAEYYMARPRITGDTNYWTGSMGWGTIDMNTIGDWGSGFIDSWSNPGNQPSGTSHWVGTQALHYTNGSSRYGWQMVGGPIGNLRFRQSWGGFGAWRTIPMLNVNDGNVGALYANIFYDSDNTGFYCDPTAFTNLNTGIRATEIYARSWLRNDASGTGHYNQATGSHSYSYQGQYWAITGNNNGSSMSLQLRAAYNGTMCRWMYGDRTWSGDLNAAGQWQLQTRHQQGYSPTLRFIESGNESWTGNIGNDAGKLEYHANRFYLEAGGNSDRIVQFRRNGADRSYIDNNGLYVGTATSARWADLAERYSADAIYENATVLGVNLDGDSEATLWQPGMPLLGVISTNPAVQMNDMGIEPGSNSKKARMNPFIALKGRIPCKVSQPVKKGQWVIPDADGKAKGVDYGTPGINSYEIIGIALSDSENGEVEVKV